MESFSHNALLFIILTTGMFLISAQLFPSAIVEGKRQTQASTTVCDAKTESCSTTICTDGQPCVTTQVPTRTETDPKQDNSNNNMPVEEQTPVEEQPSTVPEEEDPFFEDYVDRDFD
jgi:hypothetical protein